MDKIALIKAEIKRLYNDKSYSEDRWDMGYDCACEDIMSFLSTLESEEPDKNLKETAEEYADETYYAYPPEFLDFVKDEIKGAFIVGAKWQEGQLLKGSPLPEDTVLFQKGVEEGKRLMMEEAVECSVYAGKEGDKWIVSYIGNYESMLKTCKSGDKVRVIIVKED